MSRNATRVWYVGLAATLVLAMVVAAPDDVKAGSDSEEQGYLGVFMQALDTDLREGLDLDVDNGVLISGVEKGGPADEAGLKDGDVIVSFNGQKVKDPDDLRDLVRGTKPGEKVEVEVVREGETKKLTLTVGEWPGEREWLGLGEGGFGGRDLARHIDRMVYAFVAKPRLGVEVAELNKDLAAYFDTKAGAGVLVLEVGDESVAHDAGLKAGDVIVKVGDEEVSDAAQLRKSLEDYEDGDQFPIEIIRNGKKKTLTATMENAGDETDWSGIPYMYQYRHQLPRMREELYRSQRDVTKELQGEIQELKREIKKMKKELQELKK
jgi:serine protease Do